MSAARCTNIVDDFFNLLPITSSLDEFVDTAKTLIRGFKIAVAHVGTHSSGLKVAPYLATSLTI